MELNKLEKPLVEIFSKIKELKLSAEKSNSGFTSKIKTQIKNLEKKFDETAKEIFKDLTPYQITKIARHANRPCATDIITGLCKDFIELHGDRHLMDDKSIVGGLGLLHDGTRIVIIGHQKGHNTKENMVRNFGMPRPEGYRKALRLMELAERFKLPLITLVDTPGAYPGKDAEEHGQSEAIAKNILVMSRLSIPIVTIITGEGGSGGALAIAVGNRVLMMQYSIYSVISPEGCAAILWKDSTKADRAAEVLGITADVALKNKIIDGIIQEPSGGAHWNYAEAIKSIELSIHQHLSELQKMSADEIKEDRKKKYFNIGDCVEKVSISPFHKETPIMNSWKAEWEND